jgi:hypothetical protein
MKTERLYSKMFRIITQQSLKLNIHRCEAKKVMEQIENPVVGKSPETAFFFTFHALFTK